MPMQEDLDDATVAAANRFLSPTEVDLARKALIVVTTALEVARLRNEEAEQKLEEIGLARRRADLVRTVVNTAFLFFVVSRWRFNYCSCRGALSVHSFQCVQ